MPSTKFLGWLVFAVSMGAYIPLIIGGWQHPAETNLACFIIWIILAATLAYSARAQEYEGWRINLAFMMGNVVVVSIALLRGGYTFNIGPSETIGLYGFVSVVCLWAAIGYTTKRWDPDILYVGTIAVDIASFYPIVKQYVQPHDPATGWCVWAWAMFGAGAFMNFALVERLFTKLRADRPAYEKAFGEEKSFVKIVKASAFSVENFLCIVVTIVLMTR